MAGTSLNKKGAWLRPGPSIGVAVSDELYTALSQGVIDTWQTDAPTSSHCQVIFIALPA